jgi:hypothetical protein
MEVAVGLLVGQALQINFGGMECDTIRWKSGLILHGTRWERMKK